ncbi:hypothetical protein GJ744_004827 [Endocarpon pusillum]|uniref:Uncharacterized protein n=1 Tax=Endocarpon pusillum TaxID=364733 RepID=A0A8H7A872_9EURO|nr:hypothetical protein GJ744_004827 [Endocarpon pusillum]
MMELERLRNLRSVNYYKKRVDPGELPNLRNVKEGSEKIRRQLLFDETTPDHASEQINWRLRDLEGTNPHIVTWLLRSARID